MKWGVRRARRKAIKSEYKKKRQGLLDERAIYGGLRDQIKAKGFRKGLSDNLNNNQALNQRLQKLKFETQQKRVASGIMSKKMKTWLLKNKGKNLRIMNTVNSIALGTALLGPKGGVAGAIIGSQRNEAIEEKNIKYRK